MTDFYTKTHEDFGRNYDLGLGPLIFAGYATEIARRAAARSAARVLETACGTGIVTRALLGRVASGISADRNRHQRRARQ